MKEIYQTHENGLKSIILLFLRMKSILFPHWKSIVFFLIIGAVVGGGISTTREADYVTEFSIFTSGDSKGGMGKYLQIAQSMGLGGNSPNAMLSPGNIKQLILSRRIIYSALLSEIEIGDKKDKLINFYINWFDIRDKNKNKLSFSVQNSSPFDLTLEEKQLLGNVYIALKNNDINIETSLKSSIITINFQSKNKLFSYYFSKELSVSLYEFYLNNMKSKDESNVVLFQNVCDSLQIELNEKEVKLAVLMDNSLQTIKSKGKLKKMRLEREVNFLNGVLLANLKNVELARFSQLKDKDIFEILDEPVLSGKGNKKGIFSLVILMGILFSSVRIVYLLLKCEVKKILSS